MGFIFEPSCIFSFAFSRDYFRDIYQGLSYCVFVIFLVSTFTKCLIDISCPEVMVILQHWRTDAQQYVCLRQELRVTQPSLNVWFLISCVEFSHSIFVHKQHVNFSSYVFFSSFFVSVSVFVGIGRKPTGPLAKYFPLNILHSKKSFNKSRWWLREPHVPTRGNIFEKGTFFVEVAAPNAPVIFLTMSCSRVLADESVFLGACQYFGLGVWSCIEMAVHCNQLSWTGIRNGVSEHSHFLFSMCRRTICILFVIGDTDG